MSATLAQPPRRVPPRTAAVVPPVAPAPAGPEQPFQRPLFLAWLGLGLVLLTMTANRVDNGAQLAVGGFLVVLMLVFRRFPLRGSLRIVFLFLAAYLSLRYFFWRITTTIIYHDPVSFVVALLLLLAEGYGFLIYFLGIFVNLSPLDRDPVPLPEDQETWPTVDILIPTYNEGEDIIEITLLAAKHIDYPAHKFNVCLCDDGGTEQKCHDKNPAKAAEARGRNERLQALCQRVGAHYKTRAKNLHAKAGNLNSAFQTTDGELVLILDVDHVPTQDILQNTVGWFLRDPKMFLVQTPHFFVNPDPIEKNLQTFDRMPGENEMFYRVIQRGLDFWNAAFFCGSAAVLRRTYLIENGGIAGQTITEDAETALGLHGKGYRSAYIARPMISGLSPETYGGFIVQRMRWAQGMVQIFLLKNPVLMKGLRPWQRLSYLNSCVFWFFPYARIVFLVAPSALLIFNLRIYEAQPLGFFAHLVPHLVAVLTVSDFLYGKVRWSFVSELYELMQSVYCLPAIYKVFLNPRAPEFNVTPKGEQLDQDFISPLTGPFYAFVALCLTSMGFGLGRIFIAGADPYPLMVSMTWEIFNLVLLLSCIGALFERKQRRATPRMPGTSAAEVIPPTDGTGGGAATPLPVTVLDLSFGGAGLRVPADRNVPAEVRAGEPIVLRAHTQGSRRPACDLHGVLRSRRTLDDGGTFLGLRWEHRSPAEVSAKVALVAGHSERWVQFQKRREGRLGVRRSLLTLMGLGLRCSRDHARQLLLAGARKAVATLRERGKERLPAGT